MAYGITGNDDSTDKCRQMAVDTNRSVSGVIRHLVLEEDRRIRDRRGNEFETTNQQKDKV